MAGISAKALYVKIWEFEKPTQQPNSIVNPDFAVFQGYENYGLVATKLKELQKLWSEEYTNSSSIKFNYYYDSGRQNTSVYLDSFQPTSPSGKPILIRLVAWPQDALAYGLDHPDVIDAKKRVTEFANSVQL